MKHSVATYTQSKITLCPFEDKRYLLDAIIPYLTVIMYWGVKTI